MLRSSLRPRLLSPIVLALAFLAPAAIGQTAPVEPYYAATTRADVPLKSGDMDGYYHVTLLPQGQVLEVDAEGAGWARVAYPPGLAVYVGAAEVEVETEGGEAVLTRVSALKSRNAAAGFAQSWQRAVPRGSELPIGTRLRVIEAVNGPDGRPIGYLVEPPRQARGYVKADSLRVATEAEIADYKASMPAPDAAPSERTEPEPRPAPPTPEQAPAPEPETQPQARPGAEQDDSLLEPMQPTGVPGAEPGAVPGESETQTPQPVEDVTVIHQGEATPEQRQLATLHNLQEAFAEVQGQPGETAELDELASEFKRTIEAQGDDPAGRRIREALRQRLQLVELRIAHRDALRELAAKREAIDASSQAVTRRVRELERTRGYQFVGRLVRSSVYDGSRLPLMYRIVSVNESMPRTIGYLKPGDESLETSRKLGEIVGVLGTSQLDEALQLRIVTPTRIDVLHAETVGAPPPATAGGVPDSDG